VKTSNLSNMTKGWFVGNFSPTLYSTNDVEVAVKSYKAGEYEAAHYHKIATEITVIVSGTVRMNGVEYSEGDIIVIEPNDVTDFLAVTDAVNTVVKIPGANDDKYIVEK
jgi:quercetin dioxygenase-like cupin family protein